MESRNQYLLSAGVVAVLLVAWFIVFTPIQFVSPGPYGNATVTVSDENGTQLATVEVRIADTQDKRRVGLRRVENLSDGHGMLFIHSGDGRKPYIMPPEMSFPLDIVFIAPNGTVREIQYADVPEGDDTLHYPGNGQYVLEVPRGYTNETGIGPGDHVKIPETYAEPAD